MEPLFRHLLVLIAALLPTYLIRFTVFGIPTTFLEAIIWTAALIGLTQPAVRHSWRTAWQSLPKLFLFFVLVFIASAIISTMISPHLFTSLGILKGWVVAPIVYGFLVYAAGLGNSSLKRDINQALILSGLVVALLGLSQADLLDRIRGPFDVPNSLALFLAPLIVLSLFEGTRFSVLAAGVMFVALLFTESLAGVASVVAITLSGWVFLRRQHLLSFPYHLLVPLLALLFLTLVIFTPKISYLLQPNSSAAVRLQLWSISWELITEHPFLGVGLGTFEPAYQEKLHERLASGEPALPEFVFRDPHNWILSFWLNTGLLGLISFTALNVWALRSALRNKNVKVALALLTLLLFGLVDTIYWKNDLATLHWVLISLIVSSNWALSRPVQTAG